MNLNEVIKAVSELSAKVEAQGATITELAAKVEALSATANAKRDRGPASQREMTDLDAYRCKFGDHAPEKSSHKVAATALGLSYGQIYSARGGYTFTKVTKDWVEKADNRAAFEKAITPPAEQHDQPQENAQQ